jgi:hypothetical protein
MALDADEVVIGANGAVSVAPVGTDGPTDITTALDEDFIDLGYVSEDGVEITPGIDMSEINGWQSFYAIRRLVTSRSLEVGFSLLQWNAESIKLAFGGGDVVEEQAPSAGPPPTPGLYVYSPPDPAEIDYRALVIDWSDGSKGYRLHIPKAVVTDTGALSLNRTDAAGLQLTFALQATDGADPFSLITNDPAFA